MASGNRNVFSRFSVHSYWTEVTPLRKFGLRGKPGFSHKLRFLAKPEMTDICFLKGNGQN